MDCTDFRRHHLAYVDDTLPGDVLVAAERHRVECAACGAHDTLVRRSLLIAHNLPTIEPSADFSARLEARLRQAREVGRGAAAAGDVAWNGESWNEARWSDAPWYARLVQDAGGWGRQAAAAAVVLAAVSAGYALRGGREMVGGGAPTVPAAAPVAAAAGATAPVLGATALATFDSASRRRAATARRAASPRDTEDIIPAYIPLPAGVLEASALLGPTSAGIPVWPAALLAGEAPMQLRGVGVGGPSVRLVGLSH